MKPFVSRKGTAHRLICVFIVIFFFAPAWSFAQEKQVGKIIGIIGTVEILVGEPVAQAKKGEAQKVSAEVWEKVKKKQPVFTKDTFRTGRKSRLKILFEDKSLMALGPKTKISVESYLYKPEDKLRQGVINMAHGLSMYIVNKSQKNKKSSFRIVSPTGNLAARGTQGYISASAEKTLIANQAGTVLVSNSDPNVGMERKSNLFEFEQGFEPFITTAAFDENLFAQTTGGGEVPVGSMQKTTVLKGQPPTPPVPLTPGELQVIRNVVLAKIGASGKSKGLIKVEEKKSKNKKKKKKSKKSSDSSSSDSSGSGGSGEGEDTGDSGDTTDSQDPTGSDDGGSQDTADTGDTDADTGVDPGFMSDFTEGAVPEGSFGTSEDFSGGVDVFDDSSSESCSS